MKNRKRLLKTVGLLTAATVMTVSLNAESVLAYSKQGKRLLLWLLRKIHTMLRKSI